MNLLTSVLYGWYAENKASQQERDIANSNQDFADSLQEVFSTQFNQQQGLLTFLRSNLESMAKNPQGYGKPALSAMETQLRQNIALNTQQAMREAQTRFATQNAPGIGSGAQQQLLAGLQQQGGIQTSMGESQIAQANAALQNQQQQFALGQLAGPVGSLTTAAPQSGSLAVNAGGQAFNEANTVQQQGTFWSNLAGGLLGAGLNIGEDFLTGGLSSLMGGGGGGGLLGGGGGGNGPGGMLPPGAGGPYSGGGGI